MSVSKSATNADPKMNASVMALEISDLPPPETVAGLWHDVALGTVPIRVQAVGSCGLLGDRDAVAVRAQVGLVGAQRDRSALAVGADQDTVMARSE